MITPEQIEESKNGLKILQAHKDYKSLDEIPNGKYFPDYILECNSAACFFASWYQGKNDAIHFFKAGLNDVLINDAAKMDLMRKLYPKEWRYEEGDAFALSRRLERKYDVVTCDSHVGDLYFTNFNQFYRLANKYLCLIANDVQLHNKGFLPDKDDITKKLSEYHKQDIKVKELFIRPDSRGCLNYYWTIIENLKSENCK